MGPIRLTQKTASKCEWKSHSHLICPINGCAATLNPIRIFKMRSTNDQSKEKFHSPPNSVDTFSMRPIYTPSLVEFCLYIILCNVDCIGGKLSQGGRKKSRLEKPFLAACRQWVAKGEQKCTRIEQGIIAKNTAIIVLSLKERTYKIIIY